MVQCILHGLQTILYSGILVEVVNTFTILWYIHDSIWTKILTPSNIPLRH